MNEQRVLIVGAGALGLTCAYYLQLAGAKISFLVRPHRLKDLSVPQKLYSYNDHRINFLKDYDVYTAVEDLRGKHFHFVLLTLDGATCRSEQGLATLTSLGEQLANTTSNLVICGVGIGLYEHIQKTTGIPSSQLLQGSMRMFAYQVGQAEMPLPPPLNIELHNSADIAYLYFPDHVGFFISSRPNQAAKEFVQLWKNSGVIQCRSMPDKIYAAFSNTFFPFTVASELNGWQGTDALVADPELWQLCCAAQREILSLKPHGLIGKILAKLMNNKRLEKMMRDMDRDATPMGFTAFNRFHHGGKVLEQDIQIMQNCADTGKRDGRDMSAVNQLLARWHQIANSHAI